MISRSHTNCVTRRPLERLEGCFGNPQQSIAVHPSITLEERSMLRNWVTRRAKTPANNLKNIFRLHTSDTLCSLSFHALLPLSSTHLCLSVPLPFPRHRMVPRCRWPSFRTTTPTDRNLAWRLGPWSCKESPIRRVSFRQVRGLFHFRQRRSTD